MRKLKFLLLALFTCFLVSCKVSIVNSPITFNTMGGELLKDITDITKGDKVTLPLPTKEGHNFLGWYLDQEYTSFVPSEYIYSKPIMLYARWEVATYTLTFNTGVEQTSYEVKYQEDLTKYIPTPSEDYHTYMFDINLPKTMPGEDLLVNATLVDLQEEYDIVDGSILEYTGTSSDLTIPSSYYFEGNIVEITIIDEFAFFFSDIESIVIPSNIKCIKQFAFANCESLSEITLSEGLEVIEYCAFDYCESLTSINIPKTVKLIETKAFNYNSHLREINVDENNPFYKSIDGNLYSKDGTKLLVYCLGKPEVFFTVPIGVEEIDDSCFYYADKLIEVFLPEGLKVIGDSAFCCCLNLKELKLPSTVTTIERGAFYLCEQITEMTIPNGVKHLSDDLFFSCNKLEKVSIPESVTSVGTTLFMACYNLTDISVDENNQYFKSIDGNLYSKDSKVLYAYAYGKDDTSFVVPEGVQIIEVSALHGCENLENIILPNTLTTIKDYGLFNCSNLTSLTLPSSLIYLGESALLSCDSITEFIVDENNPVFSSVDGNLYSKDRSIFILYAQGKKDSRFVLPEFVTEIGPDSFYASELEFLVIHENVTKIDSSAFSSAYFKTIYCVAKEKPDTWGSFWHGFNNVVWGYEQ